MLIARIKLPIGLEIVVTRVVLRKLKRSRAGDWLVQSDLLLVRVLAWVLDRGHVLHLAGGLRGDLAEARDQIVALEELEVGPGYGVWGHISNRVVDVSNLTIELVGLEEGLLEVRWVLVATCLFGDHILVAIKVLGVLVLVVKQETTTCPPSLILMMSTAAEQEARFVLARL